MQEVSFKPGEKVFLESLEKHPEAKKAFEKGKKTTEEFLHKKIEEVKRKILEMPEIKRESELHKEEPVNLDLVASAINLSLEKSIEDGLRLVIQKGDPHLLDLFHATLVGHFLDQLIKLGKVKVDEEEKKQSRLLSIILFILALVLISFITFQLIKIWS